MKDKIIEVVKILNQYDLNEIEYENNGTRIRVRREQAVAGQIVNNANTQISNLKNESYDVEEELGHVIKSPIAGTFYDRPNPESKSFVKVGDYVEIGHPLAIIESMKVMNEICAPIKGKIVEIYHQNESNVEKGQKLFRIEE